MCKLFNAGGLGMGVTIDKSRGKTIAEKVSIKSVIAGGSAALARSRRRVGLELGEIIIKYFMMYLSILICGLSAFFPNFGIFVICFFCLFFFYIVVADTKLEHS